MREWPDASKASSSSDSVVSASTAANIGAWHHHVRDARFLRCRMLRISVRSFWREGGVERILLAERLFEICLRVAEVLKPKASRRRASQLDPPPFPLSAAATRLARRADTLTKT